MRALIVVLCLSLCSQNGFAENPAETFSLSNYKLAYAEVNKTGHTVNEYVPRGETLENWTSLIAVRKWPNETNLETVIGYYMQNIKDFKVEEPTPLSVKGKSKKNEQIFEVFLAPPNKSHLEYSVVRFVRDQADRRSSRINSRTEVRMTWRSYGSSVPAAFRLALEPFLTSPYLSTAPRTWNNSLAKAKRQSPTNQPAKHPMMCRTMMTWMTTQMTPTTTWMTIQTMTIQTMTIRAMTSNSQDYRYGEIRLA